MAVTGSDLVAQTLARLGADTFFFVMGAPMLGAEKACLDLNMRGIDVRHEQAAAMMANAYARLTNKAGVCMACSGPGTINLGTGIAHALADCAPVVALGGSSPWNEWGTGAFQEIDQVAIMRPITKWAERVYETRRIPELIDLAFRTAWSGKPGPVYLDLPGDVLFRSIDESTVVWPRREKLERTRALAEPSSIDAAIALLSAARRPVVISGSGVLWSQAAPELRRWVETAGMPLYTTPQGRGIIPEDHILSYPNARSNALKEADVALVVGTRFNYVFGHFRPPRFSAEAKVIRIEVDPAEMAATPRVDVPLLGDARAVLTQLLEAAADRIRPASYADWRERLQKTNAEKAASQEKELSNDQVPIHPLRLCREIRDFIGREAILCVDGQEILNYGRQTIPTHVPGHRLNSGVFGTMGVGLPFGIGAKVAKPDAQVVVLHGDGSLGMNGLELDTAVRHKIPVLVVVSLNGGWTADPKREKPGRDLGYTRYHDVAKALGCHSEYVEKPEDIRPALERAQSAVDAGQPALVNVVTDYRARAVTVRFSASST